MKHEVVVKLDPHTAEVLRDLVARLERALPDAEVLKEAPDHAWGRGVMLTTGPTYPPPPAKKTIVDAILVLADAIKQRAAQPTSP